MSVKRFTPKQKGQLQEQSQKIHNISQEQWDFAHLQLEEIPDIDLVGNPFFETNFSRPDQQLLSVMMNPDYFGWTCTKLFNTSISPNGLELLPMQCAVLRELWYRPFPILIASRGFSKCTTGDTIVMTNHGISTMYDIAGYANEVGRRYEVGGLKLLGENDYNSVSYVWNNGEVDTIKVTTSNGFILEGNYIHPIRVIRNGNIEWVRHEDLKIDDYCIIDRSDKWFEYTNDLSEDEAYLFGLLIGDGGYTVPGRIVFTTSDNELIESVNRISKKLWGKEFKKIKDKYSYQLNSRSIWRSLFDKYGFGSPTCSEKVFPTSVLSARKEVVAAFIRGLMDTDGMARTKLLGVGFCSKSKRLAYMLQFMLTRFGIISVCKPRLNKKYNTIYYYLDMFGEQAKLYNERIGFGLSRKSQTVYNLYNKKTNTNKDIIPTNLVLNKILYLKSKLTPNKKGDGKKLQLWPSTHGLKSYNLTYNKLRNILDLCVNSGLDNEAEYLYLKNIYNNNYFYDKVIRLEKCRSVTYDLNIPNDHSYISNGFISHNTFTLALYALLRALFIQGRKIIITGAGFRQSKLVLAYAEQIWYNSPVFRDICGASRDKNQGPHHDTDVWWMQIGESKISALPIGTGEKIRGQRAHDILADEFSSIDPLIFEEVIAGFGVVNIDPITQVKHFQRLEYLKNIKALPPEDVESNVVMPNQMVLSGTASFAFNHFCSYWKKHKNIIMTQGDPQKMQQLGIDPNLDYRKYSIIRIPVYLLPRGFMDQAQIDRSEATLSSGIFDNEFGAVFTDDSAGFFRGSILEKAMPGIRNPIVLSDGTQIDAFSCLLRGDPNKKYIMAIDPASQKDNFAIIILEVYDNHARIVHCWTTNAQKHMELRTLGVVQEKDFFAYTCRKIRDLMKLFNIIHIAIDSQGGGRTISELLHNDKYLEEGEQLIWEMDSSHPLWDGKERPTDVEKGLHIIEMVVFRDNKYTVDANHGMKSDFEHKLLLFPYIDAIESVMAARSDYDNNRNVDTLDEVLNEIDELKDELMMIQHDPTPSGNERWGAPTVKGSRIGEIHDDRYSALVMANSAARRMRAIPKVITTYIGGGFVGQINKQSDLAAKSNQLYIGPAWFTESTKNIGSYGMAVER